MNFKKISAALLVFGIFLIPLFSSAQDADPKKYVLIPCGFAEKDANGVVTKSVPCEFRHIFVFINTLIRFMLFRLAVPLAALSFMYAGFLMLTAAGNEGKVKEAKGIFTTTAWGFLIAISAFAVVRFILSVVDPQYDLINKVR